MTDRLYKFASIACCSSVPSSDGAAKRFRKIVKDMKRPSQTVVPRPTSVISKSSFEVISNLSETG